MEAGFKPSTHQILILTAPPTVEQEDRICRECLRLQKEMYGKTPAKFDGTLRGLIGAYQTDPDSSFHNLDHRERLNIVNSHLVKIEATDGNLKLADMTARDFKRIYETCRWPDGNQEVEGKVSLGSARMTNVRRIFSFGMVFEVDPNCKRLRDVLSEMKFQSSKARTESMTLRQCEDLVAEALKEGSFSIALAQAIQFEWGVRQRDVIGMWTPATEPGISTIPHHAGQKWLRGMRHEEISSGLVMQHLVSKTRKRTGEVLTRDINLYPMVKQLYEMIPVEKRRGPLIVSETTGRPWFDNTFRVRWRKIAERLGIPESMRNMDSRSGRITEVYEATRDEGRARIEAGHTRPEQTRRYIRRKEEAIRETAAAVLEFRAKNKRGTS